MESFVQRQSADVIGVLNGFDRLRLRGTLRLLSHVGGMLSFLWQVRVLLKDFADYALATTRQLRDATIALAQECGQEVRYLNAPSVSKEDLARRIAQQKGISQGRIAIFSAVEPCFSYEIHRNARTRQLELRGGNRKCLHYYHYFLHERLGLMHVRLQSWFPFAMHVCLNGREWLCRQMDAAGIGYERRDNCLTRIDDLAAAQMLMDRQLKTNWPGLLSGLLPQVNPVHPRIFGAAPVDYYWSADESEWATDVMFRDRLSLDRLYPRLVAYGMQHLDSRQVMRFLGKRLDGRFGGEVVSDLAQRPEGLRVKHRVNRNWIKMYNKQGSVLRVETVINDARDLKVYRTPEGQPQAKKQWRCLRKGVADLGRRAQLCQRSNERYLQALAAVEDKTPLGQFTQKLCEPVVWKGQRARGLNPLGAEDARLLEVIAGGQFVIKGLRNGDVREALYGQAPEDHKQLRRQSAAVTRKLRLLRAHGLIRKVPRTHRYMVSDRGRVMLAALLAARAADTAKLATAA